MFNCDIFWCVFFQGGLIVGVGVILVLFGSQVFVVLFENQVIVFVQCWMVGNGQVCFCNDVLFKVCGNKVFVCDICVRDMFGWLQQ